MDRESQQNALLASVLRKLDDLERRLRKMESLDGDGVSDTWTPTVTQVGAVSYTNHQCIWERRGSTVWAHMDVVLSATSGGGATSIVIGGLPASIGEIAQGAAIGTFRFTRGTTHYIGAVVCHDVTATSVYLMCNAATGALGDNPDITASSGDKISLTVEYAPA